MEHITVGRKYNEGKIAFVECLKNASLSDVRIKDKCFLLIYLHSGVINFIINNETVSASAPSFICFDESAEPKFLSFLGAEYYCIYFHPKFLNINMTFELLRSNNYDDIATTHDMFMLKPFLNKSYVVQICDEYQGAIETACAHMERELREQRDWYWSCRGRSYFMEIIIALERMYGLIGYGKTDISTDSTFTVTNPFIRDAMIFIEGHYAQEITLSDISAAAGINHTSLTKLLKQEHGITAMEYLMRYRIKVARKQLAFTEIPIKDIALRTGFKTVQHFSRVFKAYTEFTPAEFRKSSVKRRKSEIKKP